MSSVPENSAILDTVLSFFREDEWPFEQLEDQALVRTAFRGDHGSWRCYAQVYEERQIVIFYSMVDTFVPPERRAAAAEFLTRANRGLFIGNF